MSTESIITDDSELQAIEALTSAWEEDAHNEEPSEPQEDEVNTEESALEDEPESEEDEQGETGEEEGQEETTDDEPEGEADDDQEEEESSDDPQEPLTVKVKVNDEEHEVSVEKLKRLYGQEKALTQKSIKLADERKQYEEKTKAYEASLERLMASTKSRWEEYQNVDWLVAQKRLTDEEFEVLREDARQAEAEYKQATDEVQTYLSQREAELKSQRDARVLETHKVLQEANIGWSKEKYEALITFAVEHGMPKEQAMSIVDAPTFLILNKAFEASKVPSKSKVKKKTKTPKKTLTSKEKPKSVDPKDSSVTKLAKELKTTGSEESAEALLMARWS